MKKKKITQSVDSHHIDYSTGEIISQSSDISYTVTQDSNFVKMYLDDLSKLHSIPFIARCLLDEILIGMNYKGVLDISAQLKKDIATKLSTNTAVISNSLTKLVAAGLIKRSGIGQYVVNPYCFAKGTTKDVISQRDAFIKMTVIYNKNGREITVETSNNDTASGESQ